jgi:hypothetical protein
VTRGDWEDLAHRVLWTFVEAFAGFLVVGPLVSLDLTLVQTAAGSAGAAVLVVLKEYARRRLVDSPQL